ncbi:LysR family transcriptional regulator, partial [Streptomyces sp. SID1328]|nr:LysR family transcriptional regulator [Streptomyces sp. SID1328]
RLLCAKPFARQHGASWTPLADPSLHRGYEVGASESHGETGEVPQWLAEALTEVTR